jgi:hypothetical protein
MSADAVAAAHGHSRHSVAHALKRLVERGAVECEVIEVPGKGRIREETRRYRARPARGSMLVVEQLLPSWLAPQAVVDWGRARMVAGRSGLLWDHGEGIPGGPENGAASTPVTGQASPWPCTPLGWMSAWVCPVGG